MRRGLPKTTSPMSAEGARGEGIDSAPVAPIPSTFEDLYRQHWASMVRLGWLLSGSREIAEDVVHDAFLRLEPKWEDLREPRAYLRRSVVNGVAAHHRRREVELRHRPVVDQETLNPEFQEVWTLVADLPVRQRHALVLRFYLDMTVEGVADYLQCPAGTAKSLIHRGVAHIREKVKQ
jgi:RNA polymerase sigma factor (sigma-70 family)